MTIDLAVIWMTDAAVTQNQGSRCSAIADRAADVASRSIWGESPLKMTPGLSSNPIGPRHDWLHR